MKINHDKLKEFLLFIKDKTNITAMEIIEKDFYLNVLLSTLNLEEYVFKGGTCLAKAYLDYFRLSEDLDFTFVEQDIFNGLSTKSIKKICKEKIDLFGEQLETLGLDFVFDKKDTRYVMLGSNNKLVTFKVHYNSVVTNAPSFVKIQINFLEKIKFSPLSKKLYPLAKENNFSKEDGIYYQEFLQFYKEKTALVYDVKEIVAEKLRSLLTRRAIKARDAVDLLFIYQKFKIHPKDLMSESEEKTLFAINAYEKYKEHFLTAKDKLSTAVFSYDEVKHLVITPLKKEEFDSFIEMLKPLLNVLMEKIEHGKNS